jgi:hypothetical protein
LRKKEAILVKYMVEKRYISLPIVLLESNFVIKLNDALLTKNARTVSSFFSNMAEHPKGLLSKKYCDSLFAGVLDLENQRASKYGDLLTENDTKILNWVKTVSKVTIEDFLEITGPLYFLMRAIRDVEGVDENLKNLRAIVLFWSYQSLYEMIIYILDRRLVSALKDNKDTVLKRKKEVLNFLNTDRKGSKHATLGKLRSALYALLDIQSDADGLLSTKNDPIAPGAVRNYLAHSNVFYDMERKKIVFTGKKEMSYDEFMKSFHHVFSFVAKWLELSTGATSSKASREVRKMFKKSLSEMADFFYDVASSPDLRMRFYQFIITWRDEAEQEYTKQKKLPS